MLYGTDRHQVQCQEIVLLNAVRNRTWNRKRLGRFSQDTVAEQIGGLSRHVHPRVRGAFQVTDNPRKKAEKKSAFYTQKLKLPHLICGSEMTWEQYILMHKLLASFTQRFGKRQQAAEVGTPPPIIAEMPVAPAERNNNAKTGTSTNPRKALEAFCNKVGYDAAIASGLPKPNAAFIKTLEVRAIAIAQAAHVPPSESRDQRRVARLAVLDEDRDRQAIDYDRAAGPVVAAKKELATLGPRKTYPVLSALFIYALVLTLAMSTAPTWHDMLPGLEALLRWVIAALCAVAIGLVIALGILPRDARGTSGRRQFAGRTQLQHNTARAGYFLGGALGLVRFTGVRTVQDAVLAIGLTLAELGAVWLVEKNAAKLESDRVTWQTHEDAFGQAEDKVRATQEEHARRGQLLTSTVNELTEIDDACAYDHAMSDPKALQTIAVNAILGGYYDGINKNFGDRGGV